MNGLETIVPNENYTRYILISVPNVWLKRQKNGGQK